MFKGERFLGLNDNYLGPPSLLVQNAHMLPHGLMVCAIECLYGEDFEVYRAFRFPVPRFQIPASEFSRCIALHQPPRIFASPSAKLLLLLDDRKREPSRSNDKLTRDAHQPARAWSNQRRCKELFCGTLRADI